MSGSRDKPLVLAGDIGGTKTNLGLFSRGKRRPLAKVIETYPSREAPHLDSIIEQFLNKHRASIKSACFGIAGPVINGRCQATNLPWDVSEAEIKKRFKWSRVDLINDLTATAYAIPLLTNRELYSLNSVRAKKEQNLALVAPGTGLGKALLIFAEGHYIPVASEGGHVDFSPNNEAEVELWRYLSQRFGHVSTERILSGPGLVNIYSWLRDSKRFTEPAWLVKSMEEIDPARAIAEAALTEKHPLCVASLNAFVSILGAVAGNLALTAMTTGGVYLGGGIPPKILPKLEEPIFMKSFTNKGRYKDLLERIPVRVVLNDKAALLGAAHYAFGRLAQ
ncbi:MAG: glucokinase [Syntrophobacterales bacterium]